MTGFLLTACHLLLRLSTLSVILAGHLPAKAGGTGALEGGGHLGVVGPCAGTEAGGLEGNGVHPAGYGRRGGDYRTSTWQRQRALQVEAVFLQISEHLFNP